MVQAFAAQEWLAYDEKKKQDILMEYRLAYCGYGEVNWCEALGTVLANDEVINGLSERGGHPVVKKKLRQWYLRITDYAERLLEGLSKIDFSESMNEMQTNWIGKSYGAEIEFEMDFPPTDLPPTPSEGGGVNEPVPRWNTADPILYPLLKEFKLELKKNPTLQENILWERLRGKKLGTKIRRQHVIGPFIADFVSIEKKLIIEVDGKVHDRHAEEDKRRTEVLNKLGFNVIRFRNEQIEGDLENVLKEIENAVSNSKGSFSPSFGGGRGEVGEAPLVLRVYTTRPDTIFGVDFMVLAPEHELVSKITTPEQSGAVEAYIDYVNSRSERERMAEKKITGVFTGAYADESLRWQENSGVAI